jgi:hypothetical protein
MLADHVEKRTLLSVTALTYLAGVTELRNFNAPIEAALAQRRTARENRVPALP